MAFNRLFRKLYIVFVIIAGLSCWALLKNIRHNVDSGSNLHQPRDRNGMREITGQLNALEGEIASQQVISSLLLEKLKQRYVEGKKADVKQLPPTPKSDSRQNQINEDDPSPNKLKVLQMELQHEDHHGEVRSDGQEHLKQKNGDALDNQAVAMEGNVDNRIQENIQSDSVIGVLVFVCNRPTVKRCLDRLFKYRPSATKFPIVVSQDCGSHPATTQVLSTYGNTFTHIMQPDLNEIDVPPKEKKLKGYFNIARHYGFALNYTFNVLNFTNVIIVEDDLEIAPDFFEYFSGTLPIMQKDPSIWCVSAWNDNGKAKRINETAFDLLHRTDFFPGLGWMLSKNIWNELMVKWPRSYWDDWMREPAQRKDRICIRPEISRTSTFGKYGVSQGTYYQNHLRFIKLNDHFVPFSDLNLTYLLKDKYDVNFVRRVYSSQVIQSVDELMKITQASDVNSEFRLTYRTKQDFRLFAKRLEIMEDFRAGVPRTAYRGVVPFMYNKRRVYLAPGANWESYQPYYR